jgi:hypothetical protein
MDEVMKRKNVIIGGAVAAVLAIGGLSACGSASAAGDQASVSSGSSSSEETTPTVTKVTVPSLAGSVPAVAASKLKTVGLVASVTGDTSNPAFGVLTQDPAAGTQVEPGRVVSLTVGESPEQATARQAAQAKAAADAEAARVAAEAAAAAAAADADLSTYQEIDDRTWALVAKDPKSHVGEKYVVYGKVTQFDSATGTSGFRANTGGEQQEYAYKYDVNTLVGAADSGQVADIVEDDLLKMYVKVTGAKTYSTTIGGSTTAPQVQIYSHELIGHDD